MDEWMEWIGKDDELRSSYVRLFVSVDLIKVRGCDLDDRKPISPGILRAATLFGVYPLVCCEAVGSYMFNPMSQSLTPNEGQPIDNTYDHKMQDVR